MIKSTILPNNTFYGTIMLNGVQRKITGEIENVRDFSLLEKVQMFSNPYYHNNDKRLTIKNLRIF